MKNYSKEDLVEIREDNILIFNGSVKMAVEYYGDRFIKNVTYEIDKEKWIIDLEGEYKMELKDTVDNMLSDNYKKRFEAEYTQTKIRYEKLVTLLDKKRAADLTDHNYVGFDLNTPPALLEQQMAAMKDYLDILRVRAIIEGIKI